MLLLQGLSLVLEEANDEMSDKSFDKVCGNSTVVFRRVLSFESDWHTILPQKRACKNKMRHITSTKVALLKLIIKK